MSFTEQIDKLEKINSIDSTTKKEREYRKLLFDISKSVVDSDVVNKYFSNISSEVLSHLDVSGLNLVLYGNEIHYFCNDVDLLFTINKRKQQIGDINIVYSNNRKSIYMGLEGTYAVVSRKDIRNDAVVTDKKLYSFDGEKYYLKSFSKTVKKHMNDKADDMCIGERFVYDKADDTLTKSSYAYQKKNGRIVSKTKMDSFVDRDEYTIEDGEIYIIRNNKDIKKMDETFEKMIDLLKVFRG